MKPASAKAKGRGFQQVIRDMILSLWSNLTLDDVRSTSMGANGEDILFSTMAKYHLPIAIECKALAKVAVYKHYEQASENAKGLEPVVFIKQNRSKPLAIVDAAFFLTLMKIRDESCKRKT